jgi:lysozyme
MIQVLEALVQTIKLLQGFEGCRLQAYKCPAGIWTIGWGETQGVKEGDVWTQEQADARLRQRAASFMFAALTKCPALFREPEHRLAACASLAYNIGTGAFGVSSVCRFTKRGDINAAADAFLLWNKAGGRVLKGLVVRRGIERTHYLHGAAK